MEVAFFGRSVVIQKLLDSLGDTGLAVSVAPEEPAVRTLVDGINRFDLCVVDSMADGAETACSRLKELRHIPLIMIVSGKQPDWKKLQSVDAHGYIFDGAAKEEIAARMRAIMRRLKPVEGLKQVNFTFITEGKTLTQPKAQSGMIALNIE